MKARTRRTLAYVVPVLFAGIGIFRLEATTTELHALIRSESHEDVVEDAQQCVTSWGVREQIREAIRRSGLAGGEAVIEAAQPDDPAVVDFYRAVLAERLQDASDQIEDPACDLDRARAVLDNQE